MTASEDILGIRETTSISRARVSETNLATGVLVLLWAGDLSGPRVR